MSILAPQYYSGAPIQSYGTGNQTLGMVEPTPRAGWSQQGIQQGAGVTDRSASVATSGSLGSYNFNLLVQSAQVFQSAPVVSQVTISGTMSFYFFGWESDKKMNADAAYIVQKVDCTTGTVSTIIDTDSGTELEDASPGAMISWTDTPTSTTMYPGDWFRIIPYITGGPADGYTATFRYGSSTYYSRIVTTETVTVSYTTADYWLYASSVGAFGLSVYGTDKALLPRKLYK